MVRTVGALVHMTSVYFISFSRKAEVDMLLCLLTTAALFLVANGAKDESRKSKHSAGLPFTV